MIDPNATKMQRSALRWLHDHNASGVWTHDGTLLAGGEIAPVIRSTWNALGRVGWVSSAKGRLSITPVGAFIAPTCELHWSHMDADILEEAE